MNYDQLIQLYFDRSNALQWYWTLYVVIVGGLLAFSSLRLRGDLLTTLLISILFSFFAYKNLGAIHDATFQRYASLQAIREYPGSDAPNPKHRTLLEETLATPQWDSPAGVRNFHILSDLLTLGCVWAMELRRRRTAPTTPSHL
jgi:hypothetical protein